MASPTFKSKAHIVSTIVNPWQNANVDFLGLVRFVPVSDPKKILLGQPIDEDVDVGIALRKGGTVEVDVFSGCSVLDPGHATGHIATIKRLLSPVTAHEVGTIRCIGLNVSV